MPIRSRYAPHRSREPEPTQPESTSIADRVRAQAAKIKNTLTQTPPPKPTPSPSSPPSEPPQELPNESTKMLDDVAKKFTHQGEPKTQFGSRKEQRRERLNRERYPDAQEGLSRKLSGMRDEDETPGANSTEPATGTRSERKERNRQKWKQQQDTKYGKPKDSTLKKVVQEVSAGAKQIAKELYPPAKQFAKNIQKGAEETAEDVGKRYAVDEEYSGEASEKKHEPEVSSGKGEEKPKAELRGTKNSKYRVDPATGDLYAESKDGRWINTGKKTKYKIPETVVDDETGFDASVHEPTSQPPRRDRSDDLRSSIFGSRPSRSTPHREESIFGATVDRFDEEPRREKQTFGAGTSYLSTGMGYKMWDESKERERLEKEKQTRPTSLRVSSSYLGTTKLSGWDNEKEQEKLESFKKQGSFGAGTAYLSSGMYGGGSRSPGGKGLSEPSGKNILSTVSSGTFGALKYGVSKKPTQTPSQPVQHPQPPQQPAGQSNERGITRTERREENRRKWGQQHAPVEQPQQPHQTVQQVQQPVQEEQPPEKQRSAMDILFGSSMKSRSEKPIEEPLRKSAVNSFFGLTSKPVTLQQKPVNNPQVPPQKPMKQKSATELIFGRRE